MSEKVVKLFNEDVFIVFMCDAVRSKNKKSMKQKHVCRDAPTPSTKTLAGYFRVCFCDDNKFVITAVE